MGAQASSAFCLDSGVVPSILLTCQAFAMSMTRAANTVHDDCARALSAFKGSLAPWETPAVGYPSMHYQFPSQPCAPRRTLGAARMPRGAPRKATARMMAVPNAPPVYDGKYADE